MNQGQKLVYNAPILPAGWIEYRTATGQPYWYNTMSRQSSWVFPMEQHQQPIIPPPKKKQIKKKIPGTQWLFVITFDGYEFFYDRETKTSIWDMPEELKEPMELLLKQEEEEKENKKRALEEEQEKEVKRIKLEQEERLKEKEAAAQQQEEEATEMTEEDFMWQLQQMEEEAEFNEQEQQETMETEKAVPEEKEPQQPQQSQEEEQQTSTAVVVVEEKKVQVLDEEVIKRFYDLLRERNVSPFSVYSMEYPNLQTDPRFTLVPHNKQKALFNKYCNELSEKIKNEKKNKKKPEDEYKELLSEVTVKMYWDDFRRKYKNDPRFKAIPITKEKETLFKDHMRQLGTAKNKNPTEEYMELLRDTKEIRVGMRWRDAKKLLEKDSRYHAIDSKNEREDLFRDYLTTI